MPWPPSAGPLHVTFTLPAGAAVVATTFVEAKGVSRTDVPHGPGPTLLTARTWYEQVTTPAMQVVYQLRVAPSCSTAAVLHSAARSRHSSRSSGGLRIP